MARSIATTRSIATNRLAVRDMPFSLSFPNSNNNRAEVPSGGFDPSSTSDFTILVWINRLYDRGTAGVIFSQEDGAGTGKNLFAIKDSDKTLQGTFDSTVNTGVIIHKNKPYMVGLRHRLSDGQVDFWVDNSNVKSASISMLSADGDFRIGQGKATGNQVFAGLLTNFLFFKRRLSDAEMLQAYVAGTHDRTDLYREYLMTTGSGTNLVDTSGNSVDGTLVGSVTWSTKTPFKVRTATTSRTVI